MEQAGASWTPRPSCSITRASTPPVSSDLPARHRCLNGLFTNTFRARPPWWRSIYALSSKASVTPSNPGRTPTDMSRARESSHCSTVPPPAAPCAAALPQCGRRGRRSHARSSRHHSQPQAQLHQRPDEAGKTGRCGQQHREQRSEPFAACAEQMQHGIADYFVALGELALHQIFDPSQAVAHASSEDRVGSTPPLWSLVCSLAATQRSSQLVSRRPRRRGHPPRSPTGSNAGNGSQAPPDYAAPVTSALAAGSHRWALSR